MKVYLKQRDMKQKEFIDLVLRQAPDKEVSTAEPDAQKMEL